MQVAKNQIVMPDENDDLDLGLDELDDLDEPSTPPAGGKSQVPPGIFKALRSIGKQVRAIGEKVSRLEKPASEPTPPQPPTPPAQPAAPDSELEDRVELRQQGYTREEIAFIAKNRTPGQSLFDAAKDPMVAAAIERTRETAAAQNATPPPSQVNGVPLPEGKRGRDLTAQERSKMQEELLRKKQQKR